MITEGYVLGKRKNF